MFHAGAYVLAFLYSLCMISNLFIYESVRKISPAHCVLVAEASHTFTRTSILLAVSIPLIDTPTRHKRDYTYSYLFIVDG